jgi:hypothetical protein
VANSFQPATPQSLAMAAMANPYQPVMQSAPMGFPLSAMYNPMMGGAQFNPFAAIPGGFGAPAAAGAGGAGGSFAGGFDMGEKLPKKMGECNKFMKKFIKDNKDQMKGMSNDEKKAIAALAWDAQKGAELGMPPGMYQTFSSESMKKPLEKLMKNSGDLPAQFQNLLPMAQARLAGTDPLSMAQKSGALGGAQGAYGMGGGVAAFAPGVPQAGGAGMIY